MAKKTKKMQKPKPRMICYDNDGRLAVRYRGASPDDMIYWLGLGVFVESMGVEITDMLKNMPLEKVGNLLMMTFAGAKDVIGQVPQDDPMPGPAAAPPPPKKRRTRKRG